MAKTIILLVALVLVSWLVFAAGARRDDAGGADPAETARRWVGGLLETRLPSADLLAQAGGACRRDGIELFVPAGASCAFTVATGGSRVRRALIRLPRGSGQGSFTPAPSDETRPGPTARALGPGAGLDLVAYREGGVLALVCAAADGAGECRFRLERTD